MFVRYTHIMCGRLIYSFSSPFSIPLNEYATNYLSIIVLISICGCFQFDTIVNSTAVNILQVFEICLKMELVNRTYVYSTLVYNICFPKWVYCFRAHQQCMRRCPTFSPTLSIISLILAILTGVC